MSDKFIQPASGIVVIHSREDLLETGRERIAAGEDPEEVSADIARLLLEQEDGDAPALRTSGGSGSGNFGHAGRPGEQGGSGEGSDTRSEKSKRALQAHNPFTKEKEAWATTNEVQIATMLGGTSTGNNLPIDVTVSKGGRLFGVEVKTMLDNKASKITMRKDALKRKEAWKRSNHATLHTVVIDDRAAFGKKNLYSGNRIYYSKGVGSFRITSMTPVKSAAMLRRLLLGK